MIHIYTGNGKGKTTAAIGQVIRAAGRGLRVAWIQYCKDITKEPSGEVSVLKKNGVVMYEFAPKIPLFNPEVRIKDIKNDCERSRRLMINIFKKHSYDLVVLDELNIALSNKFLKENKIISLLKQKPPSMHIIITGRGKHKNLIKMADLVTEMKEIKHPYNKGIHAEKGIEY